MFNYLVEKLYYVLNPDKVYKYEVGDALKRQLKDTRVPVNMTIPMTGILNREMYNDLFMNTTHNNYEYIMVKAISEEQSSYVIDFYTVTYAVKNGAKTITEKLNQMVTKKNLEETGYSPIDNERFLQGVKK